MNVYTGKANSLIFERPVILGQVHNPRGDAAPEISSQRMTSETEVRILIVDDEVDIREAIKRILFARGYVVETASGSREALTLLTRQKFHLILLDIKMPEMDGIELYAQLKDVAPDLQRRVICISGDLVSSRNRGFIDKNKLPYLVKPFGIRELLEKVASVLG